MIQFIARVSRGALFLLEGLLLALFFIVGTSAAVFGPMVIVSITENANWFWLYTVHLLIVAYHMGDQDDQ